MMVQGIFLIGLWGLFFVGIYLFMRGTTSHQKKGDALWQEEVPEKQTTFQERRRYKRRHLPFPVNYGSLEDADLQEETLTQDVGKGGVRFPTRYALPLGSRLYLQINLPPKSPLSLFGEVVWQHARETEATQFDTGIKFVDLSTTNVLKIARYF